MPFPIHRPRRLRSSEAIRRLVRETELSPNDFVLPIFICPGEGIRRPISSMPPQAQMSIDVAVEECRLIASLGIGGIIMFNITIVIILVLDFIEVVVSVTVTVVAGRPP